MAKTGYIQRRHLEEQLKAAIEDAARQVIPGDNPAYQIGKQLGYSDGLKAAVDLLKALPDDPKPEGPGRIYNRSDTW